MLREPMGRRRMIATPYRRATVGRISGETGKPSGLGTCVETAVTRSSEVTVVHELRLLGDTSGAHWTTSIGAQDYWQQYLTTFDSVKIVARVSPLHSSIVGARRIDGPQIVVHAVPPYRGLVSLLVNLPKVLRSVARATGSADCLVLYLPGVLGTFAALFSAARRRSYAVYVLGDIDEVLGPGWTWRDGPARTASVRHGNHPLGRANGERAGLRHGRRTAGTVPASGRARNGALPRGERTRRTSGESGGCPRSCEPVVRCGEHGTALQGLRHPDRCRPTPRGRWHAGPPDHCRQRTPCGALRRLGLASRTRGRSCLPQARLPEAPR